MATDIKIDPTSRDFVDDGAGGWVEVDDSSTAVLCQLDSEQGAWWGDPEAGTRNKEILRSDLPTLDALIDSSKRGMDALSRAGMISNVVIQAIEDDPATEELQSSVGFGDMLIAWRDRHTSRPADLAYSPLGGNPTVT